MFIQKINVLKRVFLIFYLFLSNNLFSVTAGSDTAVGAPQAHTTFPNTENTTNKIANYAVMDDGFTLQDSTTTCSFASIFPVTGSRINLNSGKLFLFRDLILTNTSKNIFSSGQIIGNDYSVIISEGMNSIDNNFSFSGVGVYLNGDLSFKADMTFKYNSFIDGQGNVLDLEDAGSIIVDYPGSLTLKNIEITGVKDSNISCLNDQSLLILSNCKLHLSRDFTFNTGELLFDSDVTICGTSRFIYSTTKTSIINTDSILQIDESAVFHYLPSSVNRDLIYMVDNTSWFYLNGCSLTCSTTGIRLTRGKLLLDNNVTFSSEGGSVSEAICFGDNSVDNDIDVHLLAGAQVDVYGRLEYENTL